MPAAPASAIAIATPPSTRAKGSPSVPVRLIASEIVRCARKARAYSRLRYVFPGGSPWGPIPANLNTSGFISGPDRALPPANQTVSLGC